MELNKFSVLVREGSETGEGYIEIAHGQQYTIELGNRWNRQAEAQVSVDGKDIGTFRLDTHDFIVLERSPDDRGRFTFYQSGTSEANRVGLGNIPVDKLGLISVVFTPEKQRPSLPRVKVATAGVGYTGSLDPPTQSYQSGGTGLSGHSNQDFVTVSRLNLDESERTEIHLRLIAVDESRPLRSTGSPKTTGIPKPL